MKTIKVNNCHECPFCNDDSEFGKDQCNLSEIYMFDGWMPKLTRHKDCPLNNEPVKVEALL